MSNILLSVKGVSKGFGKVVALDKINLNIYRGDIIGLVGGNGAGKTSLLRLISGLYRPTEGQVLFHSANNQPKPIEQMREYVGVVPESSGMYHRLTAWENIRYHSRLHGVSDEIAWNRTLSFAKELNIDDSLMRHTRGFSKGMRQKTAILRSLSHGPEILLLDEPTAGLDVTSARKVRELVAKLRDEGGTVIYSTHHLAEAELVCDRIIILHNGQIRADGAPLELMQHSDAVNLEDAYIKLTMDDARDNIELQREGKISKIWKRMMTSNKSPISFEVSENE